VDQLDSPAALASSYEGGPRRPHRSARRRALIEAAIPALRRPYISSHAVSIEPWLWLRFEAFIRRRRLWRVFSAFAINRFERAAVRRRAARQFSSELHTRDNFARKADSAHIYAVCRMLEIYRSILPRAPA